jgi:hypothetical protein
MKIILSRVTLTVFAQPDGDAHFVPRPIFRFPASPPSRKAEAKRDSDRERIMSSGRHGRHFESPAQHAEEVAVTAVAPVVDVQQSRSPSLRQRQLRNLPVRDMLDVINSAPGANYTEGTGWGGAERMTSVHGASVRDNTYAFDGVNMNDPVNMHPITNLNFDAIEEVEMIRAATAEVGLPGAYVNIVTRPAATSSRAPLYNVTRTFQQL